MLNTPAIEKPYNVIGLIYGRSKIPMTPAYIYPIMNRAMFLKHVVFFFFWTAAVTVASISCSGILVDVYDTCDS